MSIPVVILVKAPVVAAGIARLLADAEGLTLVTLPPPADAARCAEVARRAPCVLILDSEAMLRQLIPLLAGPEPVGAVRILCVYDAANVVCIFSRQTVALVDASDLLAAVRGAPGPVASTPSVPGADRRTGD
jgi:hypothetical protein